MRVENRKNLTIGCHLSSAKGFYAMGQDALEINANTFQFFTRNPRGSKAKVLDLKDVSQLRELMRENEIRSILAHSPYTLNPCSAEEKNRTFAEETMQDDLERMEYLPGNYYNFHPGNHVGQGVEAGIAQIISLLNHIIRPEQSTMLLLETMSGKGTEVGSRFEELYQVIQGVKLGDKIGVCMDTCHVHDAGYDIVDNLDGVLDEFDRVIGLKYLRAIHLNDSKNPQGSHKDRHETIGNGTIGMEAILNILTHPKLAHLPFYLETPNDLAGHKAEIAEIREALRQKKAKECSF